VPLDRSLFWADGADPRLQRWRQVAQATLELGG
jgi:hypothetical protein